MSPPERSRTVAADVTPFAPGQRAEDSVAELFCLVSAPATAALIPIAMDRVLTHFGKPPQACRCLRCCSDNAPRAPKDLARIYFPSKHFIFDFHDTTFECIAGAFSVTVHTGSVAEVLERAFREVST